MPVQERGEGFVVVGGLVAEQPGGGPVEPLDLGQHRQIAGTGQRRPGRETARRCPGRPHTPARCRRRAPTSTCRRPGWRLRGRRTSGTASGTCGRCAPGMRCRSRPRCRHRGPGSGCGRVHRFGCQPRTSVTRSRADSTYAAVSPATPLPMTAMERPLGSFRSTPGIRSDAVPDGAICTVTQRYAR